MPDHYRLLTAALAATLLSGCAAMCKPAPPRIETVEIPVRVYVPVPAELTAPCDIATGARSEVFEVARKRRQALEACNADKAAIRRLLDKAEAEGRPL